jgi:hypothetical protein
MRRRTERVLTNWLEDITRQHNLKHMVFGPIAEVEAALGKTYHRRSVEGEYCAICLTCDCCVECSQIQGIVYEAFVSHGDDIALLELRKLGVRLLDKINRAP